MKTNKAIKSIFVIIILSLTVYGILIENNNDIIVEDEIIETSGYGHGQSIGVILIIEHERNGEIIYRMTKDDDLTLRNVAGIMHFIIKGVEIENSLGYKITTGAQFTLDIDSTVDYIHAYMAEMHIGTGTTAPTYEDYKLETSIYNEQTEAIGYSVSSLQMNATYVVTFNIDNTYAITEAGFVGRVVNGGTNEIMLFRDVFSAINVISGDLLTVKYVVMFN